MARKLYFVLSFLMSAAVLIWGFYWPYAHYFWFIVVPYIAIGIYDLFSTHNVLRLYPVIGHLRYLFEFIRPEIQQYFVATNQSGRPFDREMREIVYKRSKNIVDTLPFGTQRDITDVGYSLAYHSLAPKQVPEEAGRIIVGGSQCKKPYNASRINISAMSFGALSKTAVMALNKGAELGNFAHNTGEGGLSPYHLFGGGDIIWQLGTAYFGCRTKDGKFDQAEFSKKANLDVVKMIEIKLSQGAKPSHGGLLPGAKVNQEIAEIRGIEVGKDCLSPPAHSAFSTPIELLEFLQKLRELTGGKPIGFKLCIGRRSEFMSICKAIIETGITPDFITVDGAEGGTGAAPIEYSNRLGVPIDEALAFVHNCLVGIHLREKVRVIASGKVISGFNVLQKIAIGADMVNIARGMMFSLGCIQALRCNTNTCPTGITTQDPRRILAVDVDEKHARVKNFHNNTMKSFLELTGAMGLSHPDELSPHHIFRRISDELVKNYDDIYHYMKPGALLEEDSEVHPDYAADWALASHEHF